MKLLPGELLADLVAIPLVALIVLLAHSEVPDMSGWGFLALIVIAFVCTLLGFSWGAQFTRDNQAEQRPPGWLPLFVEASRGDQRRAARDEHPAGGQL
jgi:hypothetical protein